MTGNTPRHGGRFSKTPPFLIPGLVVVILILSFNYWRASRLNKELLERVAASDGRALSCSSEFKTCSSDLKSSQEALSAGEMKIAENLQKYKEDMNRLSSENVRADLIYCSCLSTWYSHSMLLLFVYDFYWGFRWELILSTSCVTALQLTCVADAVH